MEPVMLPVAFRQLRPTILCLVILAAPLLPLAAASVEVVPGSVLPDGRYEMSATWDPRDLPGIGCAGGCAYTVGGRDGNGWPTDEIVAYNPTSGQVWVAGHLPQAAKLTGAAFGNDVVYILPGWDAGQGILAFDPITGTVEPTGASLPIPVTAMDVAWVPVEHPGCPQGCLYTFGGGGPPGQYQYANIFRFDPVSGTVTSAGMLPTLRYGAPAVWDPVKERVYVLGGVYLNWGCNAEGNSCSFGPMVFLDDVVEYDPVTQSVAVVAHWQHPMAYGTASYVDGCIYYYGGYPIYSGGSWEPWVSPHIWAFDPESVTTGDSLEVLAASRVHPSGVSAGPVAYVLGGGGWPGLDEIVRHEPTGCVAVPTLPLPPVPPVPTPPVPGPPGGGGTPPGMPSPSLGCDFGCAAGLLATGTTGNLPPVADFSVWPAVPVAGEPVHLQDLSVDLDGAIVRRTWIFGDATPPRDAPALDHVFDLPWAYTITLSVVDDRGEPAATSRTVHVVPARSVAPPTGGDAVEPVAPALAASGPPASPATAVRAATAVVPLCTGACPAADPAKATAMATPASDAPLAGVVLVAVVLAGVAAALAPRPRRPWLPLFSRIRRDDVLDHPVRALLHEAIEASPGIHLQELVRRAGRSKSAVSHHLSVLEGAGLVSSVGGGSLRRFAPCGRTAGIAPTLAQRVLAAVRDDPGRLVSEVAGQLGVSYGVAYYHVHQLAGSGRLALRRTAEGLRASPLAQPPAAPLPS